MRTRSLVTLALLALAGTATSHAASPVWERVGPQGGPAQSVVGSGRFAYATTAGGLVASQDGGRTWSLVATAPRRPYVLALQPGDGRHLWVAALAPDRDDFTPGGVFETRDGGATWLDRTAGLRLPAGQLRFVSGFAFIPADGTPLAATQQGLLVLGDTWTVRSLPESQVLSLAFVPGEASTVLASVFSPTQPSSPTGILRSEDGGLSWTSAAPGFAPSQFVFDARNPQRVLATAQTVVRSADGGRSWDAVDAPRDIVALAALADGSFAAAGESGVLRSRDGGATWQRTALVKNALLGLASPGGTRVLVAGDRGLWRSTDGARSFRPASVGFSVQSPSSIAVDAEGTVFLGNPGVMVSHDLGAHWRQADVAATQWDTVVAFGAAAKPGTLYATGLGGRLALTQDGGQTWQLRGSTGGGTPTRVAVDPNDEDTLYLAEFESSGHDQTSCTLKSTDGGATFRCLTAPWADNYGRRLYAYSLAVRPGDSSFVLDVAGSLARSRDGGDTWTFLGSALPLTASAAAAVFDPSDPRRILVGTTDGVWLSRDDAAHFARLGSGLPRNAQVSSLVADPLRRGVFFAGVRRFTAQGASLPGTTFRSVDGGKSWQPIGDRLPIEFTGQLALDSEHGVLYANTRGHGVFRLILAD